MKKLSRPFPSLTRRLLLVYGCVLVWSVLLVARFVHLQVILSEDFRKQAQVQYLGFDDLIETRGEIYDRRLIQLATNLDAQALAADPSLIEDPGEAARRLAPILDEPAPVIREKLSRENTRYVKLNRRCSPEQVEKISDLGIRGLTLDTVRLRYFPKGTLASQMLGFVGAENRGLSGLEYLYDDQIKGARKRVYFVFDAHRRGYQRAHPDADTKGNSLVLNIDQTIQFEAEQALRRQVETSRAKSGTVIVMNPHNGEILAMTSFPNFDPNHFLDAEPEHYRNRATLDTFEPGSIFKVVSLSAVMNEGLARPDEVIDCRVGTLRIAGKVYREAKRSYGDLTFREILAKSSNVGTIKLGIRLGEEKLYEYITRFGFGSRTGIDFPGEEPGRIRPVSDWSRMSIGALSIGQELAVTPLQMLRAVATIANGGFLVRPRLVRQVLSPQGDLIWYPEDEPERIISAATAEKMRQAMAAVVEVGTGSRAALNGFSSGGKTGTAQKFVDGSYSHTRYVGSYVGFAPADDPALAALVVIDEPSGDYYGGLVAAPVFKEIMEKALIHLRIPRDRPLDREPGRRELVKREPIPEFGVRDLEDEDLPSEFLTEVAESLVERNSQTLILPDRLVKVPDFTGMSLREVALSCAENGLQFRASGSGLVSGQRPRAGQSVETGTVCEVFFSSKGILESAANRVTLQDTAEDPSGGQR